MGRSKLLYRPTGFSIICILLDSLLYHFFVLFFLEQTHKFLIINLLLDSRCVISTINVCYSPYAEMGMYVI